MRNDLCSWLWLINAEFWLASWLWLWFAIGQGVGILCRGWHMVRDPKRKSLNSFHEFFADWWPVIIIRFMVGVLFFWVLFFYPETARAIGDKIGVPINLPGIPKYAPLAGLVGLVMDVLVVAWVIGKVPKLRDLIPNYPEDKVDAVDADGKKEDKP